MTENVKIYVILVYDSESISYVNINVSNFSFIGHTCDAQGIFMALHSLITLDGTQ